MKRPDSEMTKALEDDLGILKDSLDLLKSGNEKYRKAVMGILRVLLKEGGKNNHPILIDQASKYGIDPFVIDESGKKTLDEYLKEGVSFSLHTSITRIDLINKSAEQEGISHEDDKLSTNYAAFKGVLPEDPFEGILLDGLKPEIRQAIKIGDCIYECGMRTLEGIREKETTK